MKNIEIQQFHLWFRKQKYTQTAKTPQMKQTDKTSLKKFKKKNYNQGLYAPNLTGWVVEHPLSTLKMWEKMKL